MTETDPTPERTVRLLRAKAAELEARALDSGTELADPLDYLTADLALIAGLLADHIEGTTAPGRRVSRSVADEPLSDSDREFTDEFGNVWRLTPGGPVFVRTRKASDG